MQYLYPLLAVAVICAFFLQLRRRRASDSGLRLVVTRPEKMPYKKRDYLFTKAERTFFEVLSLVVRDMEVHIFAKVRMGDLLYIPKGTGEWQRNWNRIQAKHVDFVLCDKERVQPLVAIELDDSSHATPQQIERDRFVNQAYRDAGLPLLRFPVKHAYTSVDIEEQIKQALAGTPQPERQEETRPSHKVIPLRKWPPKK